MKKRRKIIIPTPEEDAIINAGIADDPDTFELDAEWFANALTTEELLAQYPHLAKVIPLSNSNEAAPNGERGRFQRLVRGLMTTLLEEHPTLLTDADIRYMMDNDYCKKRLGLKIGNLTLLRNMETGRQISGHGRYWARLYAGKFYVCNNWWDNYHFANAKALVQFIDGLVERNPHHAGIAVLARHRKALQEYIGHLCGERECP